MCTLTINIIVISVTIILNITMVIFACYRYWLPGIFRICIGVDGTEGTAGQPTAHVLYDVEVE